MKLNTILGERDIKALKVNCDNLDNGCQWVGELCSLQEHVQKCQVLCPNKCENNNKTVFVLQKHLGNHLANECPRRRYKCPHCREEGEYEERTTVHLETCPKVTVTCPNKPCQNSGLRRIVDNHRSKCDYEKVSCKYAEFGCVETPLRRNLKKHDEDAVQLHFQLTETALKQKIKELKKREHILETRVTRHEERIEEFETRHEETIEELETRHEETIEALETRHEETIEALETRHEETIEALETRQGELETIIVNQNEELETTQDEMIELETTIGEQEGTIMELRLKNCRMRMTSQQETIQLGKRLQEMRGELESSRKEMMELETTIDGQQEIQQLETPILRQSALTFRMSNYRNYNKHRRDFYSFPFYVSGYKLCLGVSTHGLGDGEGRYLAVEACLVEGENYDSLTWPSTKSITIELLNQLQDDHHHKKPIVFPGNNLCCPKFIHNNKLNHQPANNCRYLLNDSLVFRVSVEMPGYKSWLKCTL